MSLATVQQRLTALGYKLGVVDGLWGPLTEQAINALLDEHGAPPPVKKAVTPEAFIAGYIDVHEGGLSMDPQDDGNWFDPGRYAAGQPQRRGLGTLVGSKFGVTAYALARARGLTHIGPLDMSELTRGEAISIGLKLYFDQPGFGRLPWNRVTASIVDKGWGSGPVQAIRMLQRMLGVTANGKIGAATIGAYRSFLEKHGEEDSAHLWADERIAFDQSLTVNDGPNDPDKRFINGWNNRTRSFLPGTAWWEAWA